MTKYFSMAAGSDNTDRRPLVATTLDAAKREVEVRWRDGFAGDSVSVEVESNVGGFGLVALYIVGKGWDF